MAAISPQIDQQVEQVALRQYGLLGRGAGMGNALYAIDYDQLPLQAQQTIDLIIAGGPFPFREDNTEFRNNFRDLPNGQYREFTVPTPGVRNRGARRIVARSSGILFFTACHYERVQGRMSTEERVAATAALDAEWRNGFYIITGMTIEFRNQIKASLRSLPVRSRGR
jgi:hypothetical protein